MPLGQAVKEISSSGRNVKPKPQSHEGAHLLGSLGDDCLVSWFLGFFLLAGLFVLWVVFFLPSYIQISKLALGYISRGQIWCLFQLNGGYTHPASIPSGEEFCAANSLSIKNIKLPVSFVSMNCGKPFSRKC